MTEYKVQIIYLLLKSQFYRDIFKLVAISNEMLYEFYFGK